MFSLAASPEGECPQGTPSCGVTKVSSTAKEGLLDLPLEILTNILDELPSEALQVCLDVHPTLADIVKDISFLNRHTRKELYLRDNDVGFRDLPRSFSPRLELWYFTNAAATARRSHQPSRAKACVLDRSSRFFTLACFKHSLQTWLAQAGGLDLSVHSHKDSNGNYRNNSNSAENDCISSNICNSNNWPVSTMPQEAGVGMAALVEACDVLLDSKASALPAYVTETLIKMFLALPDFLERSLYAQHLNLHRGSPVTLAHTWEVFIQPQLQMKKLASPFRPGFSLEILCRETVDEGIGLRVNAILILFSPETCVIWIGTVAPFLACKHGTTRTLNTFDMKCSLKSLKNEVGCIADMFDIAFGGESPNHRWMLQKLFPGVCHMIHRKERDNTLSLLNSRIDLLAQHINNGIAKFSSTTRESLKRLVFAKLQDAVRCLGVGLCFHDPDTASTQRCPLQHVQHNTISQTHETQFYLVESIRSGLHRYFASEAQHFICNTKSHVMVCNRCSGLWFPKPLTLDTCIARSLELELPFELWPYHVVVKALEVVNGALNQCAHISH